MEDYEKDKIIESILLLTIFIMIILAILIFYGKL